MMTNQDLGPSSFFALLKGRYEPSADSLESLSGHRIVETPTPMIQRVGAAWSTPMKDLTCEQVRLLVSQKMGLQWLAHPVTVFVLENPKAFLTFFSGDLSLAALRAFPELLEVSPWSARAMLTIDFRWLPAEARVDDPASIEGVIERAQAIARGNA